MLLLQGRFLLERRCLLLSLPRRYCPQQRHLPMRSMQQPMQDLYKPPQLMHQLWTRSWLPPNHRNWTKMCQGMRWGNLPQGQRLWSLWLQMRQVSRCRRKLHRLPRWKIPLQCRLLGLLPRHSSRRKVPQRMPSRILQSFRPRMQEVFIRMQDLQWCQRLHHLCQWFRFFERKMRQGLRCRILRFQRNLCSLWQVMQVMCQQPNSMYRLCWWLCELKRKMHFIMPDRNLLGLSFKKLQTMLSFMQDLQLRTILFDLPQRQDSSSRRTMPLLRLPMQHLQRWPRHLLHLSIRILLVKQRLCEIMPRWNQTSQQRLHMFKRFVLGRNLRLIMPLWIHQGRNWLQKMWLSMHRMPRILNLLYWLFGLIHPQTFNRKVRTKLCLQLRSSRGQRKMLKNLRLQLLLSKRSLHLRRMPWRIQGQRIRRLCQRCRCHRQMRKPHFQVERSLCWQVRKRILP